MNSEKTISERVSELLHKAFRFSPTKGQEQFIAKFSQFAGKPAEGIFILRGYAGTGKTTLMSAITSSFQNVILLAPTGRAAKVLSSYTSRPAYTIHKHLYRPAQASDGRMFLRLADNHFKRTLFIVDEASMIPDAAIEDAASPFPGVNLLTDLINYIYSGEECRLLLVGDTAQLPPVHFNDSPALDANHLRLSFRREVTETELTEVVRQEQESGILKNATALRILLSRDAKKPILKSEGFPDVHRINAAEMAELLHPVYSKYGNDNVLVITRSNKSAILYNRLIRFQQLWMEEELAAGDHLMVVKNNYYWLPNDHKAGFIANGDIVVISKIVRFEDRFGFRFAKALVHLIDYPDEPDFEVNLLMDTLSAETPALPSKESDRLYQTIHDSYIPDEPEKKRRNALLRKDPYYNALQVKFAYAVTCHKAQGGQWPVVFVDQGYMTEEMNGAEHLRWLYTAFTRASKELYLINFDEGLFKN
ncbi:AAA family ATPase [soil metagenome]